MILNHYFGSGYANRPQYRNGQDYTDFTTVHWRRHGSDQHKAVPFLVTQCKRREFEYRNSGWAEGEAQLERYLRGLRPRNRRGRLYGIVAVGRLVRFYKWNDNIDDIEAWSADAYHVVEDRSIIMAHLRYIRARH